MTFELNPTTGLCVDLFGPTVEFLTSPHGMHNDFCVLKCVIPPGSSIPLHRHPDTEDFFVLFGQAQALKHVSEGSKGTEWIAGQQGTIFTCLATCRTPGTMCPVNRWLSSFSRPHAWGASFRRRGGR